MSARGRYGYWIDLHRGYISPEAEVTAGLNKHMHPKDIKVLADCWVDIINEVLVPMDVMVTSSGTIYGPHPKPDDWADKVRELVSETYYMMR